MPINAVTGRHTRVYAQTDTCTCVHTRGLNRDARPGCPPLLTTHFTLTALLLSYGAVLPSSGPWADTAATPTVSLEPTFWEVCGAPYSDLSPSALGAWALWPPPPLLPKPCCPWLSPTLCPYLVPRLPPNPKGQDTRVFSSKPMHKAVSQSLPAQPQCQSVEAPPAPVPTEPGWSPGQESLGLGLT